MPRKLSCECGECGICKHREYQRNRAKEARRAKEATAKNYPLPHQITVWECSDGNEFTSEADALRYELELFRKG